VSVSQLSAMEQPLEKSLEQAPFDRVSQETRKKLAKLYRSMDQIPHRDPKTGQILIHEPTVHNILREHISKEFADRFVQNLRQHPVHGRLLVSDDREATQAPLEPVLWQTAVRAELAVQPALPRFAETDFMSRLRQAQSDDEARALSREVVPNTPGYFLDPPRFGLLAQMTVERLRAAAIAPPAQAPTGGVVNETILGDIWNRFWNCLVAAVGFWTAFGAVLMVTVVVILVVDGGLTFMPALMVAIYEVVPAIGGALVAATLDCIFQALGIDIEINID
jgi:hypothetical protein